MADQKYTKPALREKLKNQIMAGSRGGKPGQWSARKAQILAQEYERQGGGYKGPKSGTQRSLSKWTDEEWTTSDGKPAVRDGGTNRYLPKKAWSKLSAAERAATNQKKRDGSKKGRQFVANTEKAKKAGASVRKGKSDPHAPTPYDPSDNPSRWDMKVAYRKAAMEIRADQISERIGMDVKAASKLRRMKPSGMSVGARRAIERGLAVVDELGFLRCPPGTANAMQFTDFSGSNCGSPSLPAKPRKRFILNDVAPDKIVRRSSFIRDRIRSDTGMDIGGPDKRRRRLADSVKRLFGDAGKLDDGQANLGQIIREHGDGFSWNLSDGSVASDGYAIARPGRGFRLRLSDMVDDDGNPTDDARTRIAQMVAMNATDFTTLATADVNGRKIKAKATVLGGWKSDMAHAADGELILGEDGQPMKHSDALSSGVESYEFFYFDLTDIFDESIGDPDAYQIGKDRNQQSIAKLSLINNGNYDDVDIDGIMNGEEGAFIQTEGTGSDLIPVESFEESLANAVGLLGPEGKFAKALEAIAGTDTLDIENFNDDQISSMLGYLKSVKGFEWISPDDVDHIYLAINQLSDNLLFLMENASPEDRQKWRRWYDIANSFSFSLADELGIPTQSMSAITAILSPQKNWNQNMAMAEHLARLMSDPDFVVPDDVAMRAAVFALDQWKVRNGNGGRGSYLAAIKSIEKKAKEEQDKVKKYRKDLSAELSEKKKAQTEKWIESAEIKLAGYREQIADLRDQMKADQKPTVAMFAGKRISELSDRDAAFVIRSHSETYGGQYLGQPELELSPADLKAGVFPTRLRAWSVAPNMDGNPGEYFVEAGGDKVAATSFPTYEAAVKAFRSGGDMEMIDEFLGEGSKVRSFFNNIHSPNDVEHRDTTIDTHAIAGLTMIPIGAKHLMTQTAFTTVASTGTGQVYPLYRAAMIMTALRWKEISGEEFLPREIQSITWEQIQAMIPSEAKRGDFIKRMAQLQRLAHSPDADPRYSGENMFKVVNEYIRVGAMKAEDVQKLYGTTKSKALEEIAKRYGLPAKMTSADVVPRAK